MNQEEMIRDVQKRLFEMRDIGYRDFHARLIPTVEKEKLSVSGHRYSGNLQKSLEKQKNLKCF